MSAYASKRGRSNRLGIIVLLKGGLNLKTAAGLLGLTMKGAEWHRRKICADNGIAHSYTFGAVFSMVRQELWKI